MLRAGGLDAMAARAGAHVQLWSEAERADSLAATLAAHPDPSAIRDGGVWLLAYGSLLWNPTVEVAERRRVRVPGWQRRFCLTARAGRGTADHPGLLLGLIEGEAVDGMALRIEAASLLDELALLWRREMLTGSYVPRWLPAEDGLPVLAFTMDPTSRGYAGNLDEDAVVACLSTARGELGTCAEYLFQTEAALGATGIADPAISRLAARVRCRLQEPRPA